MTAQHVTAHQLDRAGLLEVVSGRIKDGHSLFFETEDPCLVMLNICDKPVLWANGLHKIPFRFRDAQDFWEFCEGVAMREGMRIFPGHQPKDMAYIPEQNIWKFSTDPHRYARIDMGDD